MLSVSTYQDYLAVRHLSVSICKPLAIEDYVVQPIAHVSPPKWHLGHTTWFFEEMILVPFMSNYQRFDQGYSMLFNSYYKTAGQHWLQSQRGNLSRPTVSEVLNYRAYVDERLSALLTQESISEQLAELVEIGLHHEQQHQELLLMDIKYILACNPSFPVYKDIAHINAQAVENTWRSFGKGLYNIGAVDGHFAYDNEKPVHKYYCYAFSISEKTVTNGEFLAFVESAGYKSSTHWLSMGWDWLKQENITQPLYWQQVTGKWFEFTLHGLQPLDLNAPVTHISYFEADAYARWRKARLPTEQELEIYLLSTTDNISTKEPYNEESSILSDRLQPYRNDISTGQIWCWTSSHYSPYPGYKAYQGILNEYNGKFMCNQFVLRGGCIATPNGHYRHSYRNFYEPHQRWMFSGIRLVKDI